MSKIFVGREKELKKLTHCYSLGDQELAIVYGRRRIGKTALLSKFTEDKNTLWITGIRGKRELVFEAMTREVNKFFAPEDKTERVFRNVLDLFEFLFEKSISERFVCVLDEFPYLAEEFEELPSILQLLLDRYEGKGKLFLILCGSSMHFMEHQVLGKESPLYGRRGMTIKLQPFDIHDTSLLVGRDKQKAFELWSVTGGVALYLNILNRYQNVEDAIISEFLDDNGFFSNEASNIFLMEFNNPINYESICRELATGNNKVSAIASKLNMTTSLVAQLLSNMQNIGIVEKIEPFESNVRKPVWAITDQMIKFWYKFVYPLRLMRLESRISYWRTYYNQFLSNSFEMLCRISLPSLLPSVIFANIRSWWGRNPITKQEEEIDVVATDITGTHIYCGECKYTNKPVSNDVLNRLIARTALVSRGRNPVYLLFSKSGFEDIAVSNNLLSFDFEEIMAILMA